MLLLRLFFVLLCLLSMQQVNAVEVKGLYEVEVQAKSRSNADRNAAIKEGLGIVLGRVLAADDVMQTSVVKTALNSAEHYVRQFQFSMSAGNYRTEDYSRLLRVRFDEQYLLDLLRDSNVGVWSEIRPETLVWLVVEEHGKRSFMQSALMPEFDNAFSKASRLKGLPIIFPMLDLEEQQKIAVHEVLSNDSTQLLAVSERYDVASVLSGRVVSKGNCWQAEWALHFDGNVQQWVNNCAELDKIILAGMQGVYDVLSKFYAVKPEIAEAGYATVKIRGIQGMNDMLRVTQYLEALPMISSVKWVSVINGYNVYKIKFSGNEMMMAEAIVAANVLAPVADGDFADSGLKYQLVKH
jgi:uncharacterized protein